MTPIRGKDVFVWVKRAGVYILTVCSKTCSFDLEQDEIATATVDSGTDETFKPGYSRFMFSMSSLKTIDTLGRYQFYEFIQNRRTVHEMKVVFTNRYGDILQYEFNAIVKSCNMASDVKTFTNADLTMRVTGTPVGVLTIEGGILDSNLDYITDGNGVIIR